MQKMHLSVLVNFQEHQECQPYHGNDVSDQVSKVGMKIPEIRLPGAEGISICVLRMEAPIQFFDEGGRDRRRANQLRHQP